MKHKPLRQKLLAIQSAVMAGAVGNDAAMPVYTHFHIKAGRLDTVRLAAHPGFGTKYAEIMSAHSIEKLLADYQQLAQFSELELIQTGYLGHASQIGPIARFIAQTQSDSAELRYILDPVLGDAGRLYVDPDIRAQMIRHLLPLAHILTPNHFELDSLTGKGTTTIDAVTDAARTLLNRRLEAVFVTGISLNDKQIADLLVTQKTATPFLHKRRAAGVSGSGDVLTALLCVFILQQNSIEQACQKASQMTARLIEQAYSPLGLPIPDALWRNVE